MVCRLPTPIGDLWHFAVKPHVELMAVVHPKSSRSTNQSAFKLAESRNKDRLQTKRKATVSIYALYLLYAPQ